MLRPTSWWSCLWSLLAVLPCLAAQATPASGDPTGQTRTADRIERHGITWRFAQRHVVGSFANGDPWVVGPVHVVEITPRCVEVEGRVLHGSMIDPDPASMQQGYDSALFGVQPDTRYDAARNVALAVARGEPCALRPQQSLVSVQSRTDAKLIPILQTAAVLTCVDAPPAPDAFRPPYVKGDKSMRFRAADLDGNAVRRVKPVADAPNVEALAPSFERLWLDHFPEWPCRYAHPLDNMPDYGRDQAAAFGSGALALQFDVPFQKKRELAIRLVQIGIDLHACLRGGCRWQGIGGHGSGRKLPILLAGRLLNDEAMLAIGRDYVSRPADEGGKGGFFSEDSQTFFVTETKPGVWNGGHGGYTKEHKGLAEWGFSHCEDPRNDRVKWDENPYRRCCTANAWLGHALVARMMGLQEAWAHPPFFAYVDRYMKEKPEEAWHRAWVPWHAAMWDAYRAKH